MKKIIFLGISILSFLNAGGDIALVAPIIPTTPEVINTPSNFYIGGALSAVSARKASSDLDFFSDKKGQDRLVNLMLLGGYNYNKYLSIETRLTTTIAQKDFTKFSGISLFVKPKYPVTNNFNIYALIGGGYVKLDNNNGSNVDVAKGSFQWGVGASYNITNKWAIFTDYTSLGHDISGTILDSNKADVDSLNVGVTYNF